MVQFSIFRLIQNFLRKIKSRWEGESGYREVLKIAFPLILSTGSWSLQHFVDRMFLTWYSPESIAASLPAGLVNWTLMSLLIGTAAYVNTFVAQYFGAKKPERIGPSVWQGIYLAVFTLPILAIFYLISDWLFAVIGHEAAVQAQESIYFKILLIGGPFMVIGNACSSFFSGLGKTWIVMWVNIGATVVNLVLDYLMIFGYWGFPEMGIAGAGWATSIATIALAVTFYLLMTQEKYERVYRTASGWRFDMEMFRRLIRFGLPQGWQFVLEVSAFTIFILLVGHIGNAELAASNIAFNINSLAFMPMFGLTIAVSTLVGQRLGENRPDLATKTTWSAFHMGFAFFGFLGVLYYMIPDVFIWPFAVKADPVEFVPIQALTENLLKFVALYCLFDAGNMIFSGALKGAGDTRYVALISLALAWGLMLMPSFVNLYFFGGGIYWLWFFVTLYIAGVCLAFFHRFMQGRWKSMRVIEIEEDDAAGESSATIDVDDALSPAGAK